MKKVIMIIAVAAILVGCKERLLRQRYEDYAWLLFQLEKDTEVFNLTHNTRDWTFEDWREFYLKKAKEDKQ